MHLMRCTQRGLRPNIPMPSSRPGASTPSKQLAVFIDRFDPPVQRLIRAALAELRKVYPTAIRLVYDNYNALAIGFCSTPRASDCLVSVAAFAHGVNLYFYYGARLPDPQGRLEGAGRQGRFVRFALPGTTRDPAVRGLLRAAAVHARTPLPKTGRGPLVIQSISPTRRPRSARAGGPKRANGIASRSAPQSS